ncbi:coproporphyrinogen-III oxidase family protein [Streptomyces blastmyceticus]|uniref:Heme chaperone HemW n=1 Tax=Streptomyces blastmyceticus TaxID=68180 RepID=A0ABN0WTW3_9ACTN
MLSPDFVNSYLDSHLGERQVNKIQHSFPSPRYWNELSVPLDELDEDRRRLREMYGSSPVFLYIGVPYCIKTDPGKCGYCLFPVEEFQGNAALENYYGYVEREAEMYREQMEGTVLTGAYFGGGTSNLYKAPVYHRIMDMVRRLFPEISREADLTLEGIPQLFTREKMEAIAGSGMNRISMGVQQVNERLNSLSGRKQTTKHVIQSLEWAREFGLSVNVDLIFGWPQQTVDTLLEDLETLVSWEVYDITHYELNVGGPTDFALNRYHELPSTLANLELYRAGRDFLLEHGYRQLSTYNFRRPGDPAARGFREGYSTTRFEHMDNLGLGYAAISFFNDPALAPGRSWSFINHRSLPRYKAAIDEGQFPVERGFRHAPEDFLLTVLFRSLISTEIDRTRYRAALGLDIYEKFATVWDALAERGLAEITPEWIRLVGDGAFYAPMISSLIAEERYRELREEAAQRKKEARRPAVTGVTTLPVPGVGSGG